MRFVPRPSLFEANNRGSPAAAIAVQDTRVRSPRCSYNPSNLSSHSTSINQTFGVLNTAMDLISTLAGKIWVAVGCPAAYIASNAVYRLYLSPLAMFSGSRTAGTSSSNVISNELHC
jgi:hypothetical protein